jgi:hypothetical protein
LNTLAHSSALGKEVAFVEMWTSMPRRPKTPPPEPTTEARLTLVMRPELLERVRNAAFWTPGETLAGIGYRGVMAEIEKMEKANGGPFPQRTKPNRIGRPSS